MPIPAITRLVRRRYGKNGIIPGLITYLTDVCVSWRVVDDYKRMEPYLKDCQTILDIGMGGAMVYKFLKEKGYYLTGVDVADLSLYPEIKPIIYNGSRLDFKDKSFDAAILDRTLHHCGKNQERVLKESFRVAKRIFIIEDIYRNSLEKLLVAFNDSMANWEWHKHHYRNLAGWKQIIESLGGRVIHQEIWVEIPQWTIYTPHLLLVANSSRGMITSTQ